MEEKEGFLEIKSSKDRSIPAIVIGSVAGVVASTAAGWFLRGYCPTMNTTAKNMIMKAGIGLVAGCIGTAVNEDISNQVDETVDVINEFRKEVAARKEEAHRKKEIEIV